ncbi:hypothetical protein B0T21DRAFT_396118 [Apiosordaria backusii]|uniref:Uncharacterized protein n=1 Tax=Apiosordaria backusii TaxID=314023 RepID=A0AA40AIM9_9PEZI|nr:hypothetical protein B0T21DRAFT_396118 [Apiosordaria backusii]
MSSSRTAPPKTYIPHSPLLPRVTFLLNNNNNTDLTITTKVPSSTRTCNCHRACASKTLSQFEPFCPNCIAEHNAPSIDNRLSDKGNEKGTHEARDDDTVSVVSSSFPKLTTQQGHNAPVPEQTKSQQQDKKGGGRASESKRDTTNDGEFVPSHCSSM